MKYDRRALRRLMTRRGVDLGTLAQQTRLSRVGLRMIEKGVAIPNAGTLARVATALRVPVGAFFEKNH